jgi:hypothetical protein
LLLLLSPLFVAMVDRIPLATPFPWAGEKQIAPVISRNPKGSGKVFLQNSETISVGAKKILATLLGDDLLKPIDSSDTVALKKLATPRIFSRSAKKRRAADASMDHDTILRLSQDGKLSLLGSILQMVKDSSTPVSAKDILKQCLLAVSPGSVPATMDAREYVLAALHYLSAGGGQTDAESSDMPNKSLLPLIRVVDADDDLEKCSFGPVELSVSGDDFELLETGFETSARSRVWLSRVHMVPPDLNNEDEAQLFLKGTIPASAKPKKQVGTKRKATSTPPPPSAGAAAEAVVQVPVDAGSTTMATPGMVPYGGAYYYG